MGLVWIVNYLFLNNNTFESWYLRVLITMGISLIATTILCKILDLFLEILLEKKLKIDNHYDNYKPILKLRELGFVVKDYPPSAKSTIKGNGPLNISLYKAALNRIVEDDRCEIQV